MPITLFGATKVDNQTTVGGSPPVPELLTFSIAPPADMVTGHLVVLDCFHRATNTGTAGAFDMNVTGGQTWTAGTKFDSTTSLSVRRFWCRFNGTWSGGNPSVNFDNWKANGTVIMVMTVFAPSTAGATWAEDVAEAKGSYTAAQDLTGPSVTTNTNSAVVVSSIGTADDNSLTLYTEGNWVNNGLNGINNTVGSDASAIVNYCVKDTAGSTGTYVVRETANNNDAGLYIHQAWYEVSSLVKKLKILVNSAAAGATGVSGWVFNPAGTVLYGSFTNASFATGTGGDTGYAVLKVPVSEFGGGALQTSDAPLVVTKTSTYGTSLLAGSVIEE
jgi:hypothetical protein